MDNATDSPASRRPRPNYSPEDVADASASIARTATTSTKEDLYPANGPKANAWRMDDETLAAFIRQYIAAQPDVPEISFGFQGGEPTLLGVDFFRKVVAIQARFARPGQLIPNMLQTNGTLLDDEWGQFLSANRFLVGISIDGPADLHDRYRYDKAGRGSHAGVIRGLRVLQKHRVDYNVLCVLNRHNAEYPLRIYRYFKELGANYIQFIPLSNPLALARSASEACRRSSMAIFCAKSSKNGWRATSARRS